MKRLLALLLAAMLVIGDAVPAFAETLPETTEQFTVAQELSVSGETGEETMEQAEEETGAELFAAAADGMDPEGCIPEYDPGLEHDPDPEPDFSPEPEIYVEPEPMYTMRITGGAMGYFTVNDGEEELWEVEIRSSSNYVNPVRNILYVGSDAVTAHPDQSGDGDYVFTGWEIPDELPEREINYIHASFEEGIRAEFEVSGNAEGIFTVKVDPDNLLDNDALIIGTMVEARGESLWFSNQVFDGILARIEGKSCEYCFKEWSGIPEDGILTENTTITAVFESTDNPVVSVSATEGGAVSPAEDFKVPMYTKLWADGNQLTYQGQGKDSGFSGTVTAEAEAGYQFSGWYLNDGSFRTKLRSDGNYENGFYVVNCDTAFVAKFSKLPDTYRIHAYCKDGGGIVTPTYVMANYGDTFREDGNKLYVGDEVFEATAYYGYKFKRWSGVPQNVTKEDTVWAEFDYIFKSLEISAGEGGWIRTLMNGTVKEVKKLSGQVWIGISLSYGEGWLKIGSNYYYASPDAGYQFDHWTFAPALDEKGRITGDTVIGAVFRVSRPTVTLSCWSGGSTDPAGPIEVAYNTPIRADGKKLYIGDDTVITAVPDENFVFAEWLNIPKSGLITDELTVTAKFVKDGFRVVIGGNSNTELFVNSVRQTYSSYELEEVRWGTKVRAEGNVLRIGDQEFRAEAKTGFAVDGWDGIPADGIVTGETYIVPKTSVKTWDLNAEAGEGGKLETSSGYTYSKYAGKMANGGKLSALGRLLLYNVYNSKTGRVYEDSLEAVANTGYRFVRWEGLPDTGKADRDVNAKAVFEPITSTVTIKRWAGAGGTVDVSCIKDVEYGTEIKEDGNKLTIGNTTVTATADEGYGFVEWTGIPKSGKVTDDLFVKAVFAIKQYSVQVKAGEGGTIDPSGSVIVNHFDKIRVDGNRIYFGDVCVTATASGGYEFTVWSNLPANMVVDGTDLSNITANFKKINAGITKQPANQTAYSSEIVTFSVEASGYNLSYQWQELAGGSSWSDIAGATALTYSFKAVYAQSGHSFRLKVTDGLGTVLYSNAAGLTVYQKPMITAQPADSIVASGDTATFTVAAAYGYGSLIYQWQRKLPSSSFWSGISESSAKKASYQFTVNASNDAYQYRCVVTDSKGTSVTSNAAKLTVYTKPSISSNPGSVSVYAGDKVELKVTAGGTVQGYQWQQLPVNGSWSDIAGATGTTYSFTADVNKNNYQYRCKAIGMYGSEAVSSAAKVTVTGKPAITAQPVNQTVYSSATAKFSIEADGYGTLSYQWECKPKNYTTWNTITAGKSASIEVSTNYYGDGCSFRCTITDSNGSKTVSNEVKLTVVSEPKISSNPSTATVYEGDSAAFSVKASGYNLSYQWQELAGGGSWSDIAGATALTYSFKAVYAQSGHGFRLKVTDGLGTVLYSSAAGLTVYRKPVITAQPIDRTFTPGEIVEFSVSATGGTGTLSYQWQSKRPDSSSWYTMSWSGAKKASYREKLYTADSGYQYRCVVTDSKGVSVTSNAATVYTKPSISSNPGSVSVYAGDRVELKVTAGGTVKGYQWQQLPVNGSWSDIAGATGTAYSFTADMNKNNYQYRCKAIGMYGSEAVSSAAKVTVVKKLTITAQPKSVTAERRNTVIFSVGTEGGNGTLSYQWQEKRTSSSSWKTISGTAAKKASYQQTAGISSNGYSYRCVVTDSKGAAVTSNAAQLTVLEVLSINSHPQDVGVGSGMTASFTVSASGAEIYQWQTSTDGTNWANCSQSTAGTRTLQVTADSSTFGRSYRCVVSNSLGKKLTSNAAKLSKKETVKIVSQPVNTTVKKNEYATFTVGATGDGLTYKWYYYDSENGWMDAGSTSAKLSIKTTRSMNNRRYRCYVKDKYGNYQYTNTVYLYVTK